MYSENKIEEGLKLYLKANEFNPNNSDLNFKIGYCYYNSSQKYDCLEYFKKAYELNPKVDKKIEFYLARGYHFNYDFDKAISLYSSYLQDVKDKVELEAVGKHIAECRNGKELVKDTVKVEIINLGENINTEYREYGPMVVADGSKLYFTSRRKGSTGGQVAPDGMFLKIYMKVIKLKMAGQKQDL